MPPEVRDRVFEPFFTTKEKGRGTGLGLYGFVKQCVRHVTIYSEVGHGTTFNLYFPCADQPPLAKTGDKGKGAAQYRTRETILVVEDDARVRQLTLRRLQLIGYQVLEANDGPRAIAILDRDQPIDLVFTDLIMPGGMSGHDVAVRSQELRPSIKVFADLGLCRRAGARR